MSVPILLEIKRFQNALPEFPLSDSWKIPTLKSNDIIWNIVSAYLYSIPRFDESELKKRIQNLTNDKMVNERFLTFFQTYNPFLLRDACCKNEEMIKLVSIFKMRVNSYMKRNKINYLPNAKCFSYLEASSRLLSCHILLFSFSFLNKTAITIFPVKDSTKRRMIYPTHILIVDECIYSENVTTKDSFSFCIPKEIGIVNKRQSLLEILNTIQFMNEYKFKTLEQVCGLPGIIENFLLTLLKNNLGSLVTFIYESPSILSNLTNAGFEMDPRLRDETGKSAMFYALKTEQWHLVILLYDYFINSCITTDILIHSDKVILENLQNMKDHLKLLEKDLECDEIRENSRCLFRDLFQYNDFQIDLFTNINNINSKLDYYDYTEDEYEFSKTKEKILVILKSYFKFRSLKSNFETSDESSRFKEFHNRIHFFEKLDCSLAMLFLNGMPNEKFSILDLNVVSYFFHFVFFQNLLQRYEKNNSVKQWVKFQESLFLEKQMCNLKEIIQATSFSNHKFPAGKYASKHNLKVYEHFFFVRLQNYLNAATFLSMKDQKSILVIERCLYVLGESCEINSFSFYKSKFYSALPKQFVKLLKKIYNYTSRIHSDVLLSRKVLEQDLKLFEGIRIDLIKLKDLLLPVFLAHEIEMEKLILSRIVFDENTNSSISKKTENELEHVFLKRKIFEKEILQSIQTSNSQEPCDSSLDDLHTWLTKQIFHRDFNLKMLNKDTYHNVLQNSLAFLSTLCNSKLELNDGILQLESQFRYVENLLTIKAGEHYHKLQLMKNKRKLFIHNCVNSLGWKMDSMPPEFNYFGTLLEDYKKLADTICPKFTQDSEEQFHFENILEYYLKLHSYSNLDKEEKHKNNLSASGNLIVDWAADNFLELKLLQNSDVAKENEFEPESKCLDRSENKRVPNSQFTFFRNRIKFLKNLLISENNSILQLLERAVTPCRNMLVKEKISRLYMSDKKIQASVEMIAFDCINILNSRKLKNLWELNTNLFCGINLSKVLARGHSLYFYNNSYIPYYYPNDSLDELMEKIVNLLSDENILDCIQEILDQSGTNFTGFMHLMNDDESEQFRTLREQILKCDHWKRYALLIHF